MKTCALRTSVIAAPMSLALSLPALTQTSRPDQLADLVWEQLR